MRAATGARREIRPTNAQRLVRRRSVGSAKRRDYDLEDVSGGRRTSPARVRGRPRPVGRGRLGVRPSRTAAIRRAAYRVGGLVGLNQSTTLARRFLLASLLVLVVGGLLVGWWVGNQLSSGIIDRTASVTGLYVESFIQPHLQGLDSGSWLSKADVASLDTLLSDTSFGDKIVALKIWRPDGTVAYSPDRSLIGQQFEVDEDLQQPQAGPSSPTSATSTTRRTSTSARAASTGCSRCTSRCAAPDPGSGGPHHRRGRVLPAAHRDRPGGAERAVPVVACRRRWRRARLPVPVRHRPPGQQHDPSPAGRAPGAGHRAPGAARPERAAARPRPTRSGAQHDTVRTPAAAYQQRPPRRPGPDARARGAAPGRGRGRDEGTDAAGATGRRQVRAQRRAARHALDRRWTAAAGAAHDVHGRRGAPRSRRPRPPDERVGRGRHRPSCPRRRRCRPRSRCSARRRSCFRTQPATARAGRVRGAGRRQEGDSPDGRRPRSRASIQSRVGAGGLPGPCRHPRAGASCWAAASRSARDRTAERR